MEVRPSSQMKLSLAAGVLPPELVVRCLEFLPFGKVHTELKQVSKEMRAAARRALTRGRWRPVRLVMERSPLTWGRAVTSVEALRAAWEIEPKLAFLELADWDRGDDTLRPSGWQSYEDDQTTRLLSLVEPSIDGLSRIVAACEGVYEMYRDHGWARDPRYSVVKKHHKSPLDFLGRGPRRCSCIIKGWSWWVGCPINGARSFGPHFAPLTSHEYVDVSPIVGPALESWADPKTAFDFLSDLVEHAFDSDATGPRHMSATWRDRGKADAFVAYALQLAVEYLGDY